MIDTPETDTPELEAAADAQAALSELTELSDEDLLVSKGTPKTELVAVKLPGAGAKHVRVRRLTGEETITAINDANKDGDKSPNGISVLKLTRCLASSQDHAKARFTDTQALDLISSHPAETLKELLRAIHFINPLIKGI